MISLKDAIEIKTTPKQVFDWLENLPAEYRSWHPDHISCKVLRGSTLEEGTEFECEEYLHGKLHTLRMCMTQVVPDKRVEFDIVNMGRGAFEVEALDDAVLFVAELEIGSTAPILGPLIDFLFASFFRRRIEAMQQHMTEEGQNLKLYLESQESVLDSFDSP
jgi:hypothetical protein